LTLVEGIASGVIVSSIVEFLKGIVQQIKGKKGKVLFPKEQEKFKQAIKMSDSSELKNNPIILEISGNYNYVCIDGKYGICDKETHEEKIIPTLKKSKEQEIEQKISIMPINEAERLINYKNSPKHMEKNYQKILDKVNPKYKSLISLSIYVEQCYQEDRKEEAESTKKEIKERYYDFGLKFVNLWARSYLKSLFSFILQKPILPLNINDKLSEFIEKAESIFFIHPETDYRKISSDIIGNLKRGKSYVAVHSLGASGPNALKIIQKVKTPKNFIYEEIQIVKKHENCIEVSKIWYRERDGFETYLLIKDITA